MSTLTAAEVASTPRSQRDPGGIGVGIQATTGALLVALGVTDTVAAKWALIAQLLISLATQLWVRARAWPPAKVWLESMAARASGTMEGIQIAQAPLAEPGPPARRRRR